MQDLLQQELPEEPPKPEKVSSHINYGREIHFLIYLYMYSIQFISLYRAHMLRSVHMDKIITTLTEMFATSQDKYCTCISCNHICCLLDLYKNS